MATVTETVKESLVGSVHPTGLTNESRTTFFQNSRQEGEDGELYMNEEDFINAIAPPQEDYVSFQHPNRSLGVGLEWKV